MTQSSMPAVAKQNGANVVEVNPEKSFPNADYYLEETAGTAMSKILEEIKIIAKSGSN
ncbi:MAG: hypothetical protein PVF56_01325 [Desulfobacterales bacterium]|jgi:hypothetical protein